MVDSTWYPSLPARCDGLHEVHNRSGPVLPAVQSGMARKSKQPEVFTPIPSKAGDRMPVSFEERLASLDRATHRMAILVDQIPDVQSETVTLGAQVDVVDAKVNQVTARVEKVEGKIDSGHRCAKVSTIDRLGTLVDRQEERLTATTLQNVAIDQKLHSMGTDIRSYEQHRREWFRTLAAIFITLASTLGSGIWFLSRLEHRVEVGEQQRQEQYRRLEGELRRLPPAQTALTSEVRDLRRMVVDSQEDDSGEVLRDLCKMMPSRERRAVRSKLKAMKAPIPPACEAN